MSSRISSMQTLLHRSQSRLHPNALYSHNINKNDTDYKIMNDYRTDAPPILRDFLAYHETIKAHSKRTVDEYYLDLRNFFRYMKQIRNPALSGKSLDEISILDVDLNFVASITLTDIYGYMTYLSRDRARFQNSAVDGKNQERDYAILTLFLNCGLRISELVGLNLQDIQGETLRVLGKGNKVRILYLNDACQDAIKRYLSVRRPITGRDANALFLSAQNERVSRSTVHAMVKKRLAEAGLDASEYSSHKLRHTAATLMLQNGVDVRAVQEVLGHDHLNTTEIYTHIDNEALRVAAKANPLSRVKASKKAGTNE